MEWQLEIEEIDRIDLVDAGACPGADVLLYKRNDAAGDAQRAEAELVRKQIAETLDTARRVDGQLAALNAATVAKKSQVPVLDVEKLQRRDKGEMRKAIEARDTALGEALNAVRKDELSRQERDDLTLAAMSNRQLDDLGRALVVMQRRWPGLYESGAFAVAMGG